MTLNGRLKQLERLIAKLLPSSNKGPDPLDAELDRITAEALATLFEEIRPVLELVEPCDTDPETFRAIQHELATRRNDAEAAARFAPPPEPVAPAPSSSPTDLVDHELNARTLRSIQRLRRRQDAMDRALARRGLTRSDVSTR